MQRPPVREFCFGKDGDVNAADGDGAAICLVDSGNQIEKGALPGTGRPHQREKVSIEDFKIDIRENRDRLASPMIGLAYVPEDDKRLLFHLLPGDLYPGPVSDIPCRLQDDPVPWLYAVEYLNHIPQLLTSGDRRFNCGIVIYEEDVFLAAARHDR